MEIFPSTSHLMIHGDIPIKSTNDHQRLLSTKKKMHYINSLLKQHLQLLYLCEFVCYDGNKN